MGVALIRGRGVPVVDLALLLTGARSPTSRFVSLGLDGRSVALAVGEVSGLRRLDLARFGQVPPLFGAGSELLQAVGTLDGGLLRVLNGVRLVELAAPPLSQGAPS
jgi:chemotaxis signal transduction protein